MGRAVSTQAPAIGPVLDREGSLHKDLVKVLWCNPCWVREAAVQYSASAAPAQEASLNWSPPLHDSLCCLNAAPSKPTFQGKRAAGISLFDHRTRTSLEHAAFTGVYLPCSQEAWQDGIPVAGWVQMWCRVHHNTADASRTVPVLPQLVAPSPTFMTLCTTDCVHVCRDEETWDFLASPATFIPGAAVSGSAASEATCQSPSGAKTF